MLTDVRNNIKDLYTKVTTSATKAHRSTTEVTELETKINTHNTQTTTKYEELKRNITEIEKSVDSLVKTAESSFKTVNDDVIKKVTEVNKNIDKIKTDLTTKDAELFNGLTNVNIDLKILVKDTSPITAEIEKLGKKIEDASIPFMYDNILNRNHIAVEDPYNIYQHSLLKNQKKNIYS